MADRFYVDNYDTLKEKERGKLRQRYVCQECGEWVTYWLANDGRKYLACHNQQVNQHEGIAREFTPPDERITIARRELMDSKMVTVNQALAEKNLPSTGMMNESQALQVCRVYWPDAPDHSIEAAAYLCRDYGLHPGANHIYLIPYAQKDKDGKVIGQRWEMIWSIAAKRLVTMRIKGQYSYIDDTPRIMSEAEQIKIFGAVDKGKVRAITKLKNMQGMEVSGHGEIGSAASIKGADKGNSLLNMAMVRSESRALDRLPGNISLPVMEAIDAAYAELPDGQVVDVATGQIIEVEAKEIDNRGLNEKEGRDVLAEVTEKVNAKPKAKTTEPEKEPAPAPAPEPEPPAPAEEAPPAEAKASPIDLEWLKEQLFILQGKKLESWTNGAIIKYLNTITGKEATSVSAAVKELTKGQAVQFTKKIKDTVEMA